jgi:hypothetical protein
MNIFCSTIFFLFIFTLTCFAELNLYLYPRAESKNGVIAMSDIAKIETDLETAAQIGSIGIDDSFFSDGYLDRKEIMDILKDTIAGRINIYGSGVRVVKVDSDAAPHDSRIVVQKGKMVRFQVINAGIRVELMGTAIHDGAVGDEIPVKLKGSTVSRGRILNERMVELAL